MAHSTTTKHAMLTQWLKSNIENGTFAIGHKIPSENELASQFGISRQTVRHSISLLEADGYVSREQGSGTYVRQYFTSNSTLKTMRIGVITTYLDDYIFPGIIHSIEEVMTDEGYTLSLGITHNKPTHEEKCLRQMLQSGIDGLIIEGTKSALPTMNTEIFQHFKDLSIPMVFFNGYYAGVSDSYVVMDDRKAGQLLCNALIKNGHTKIGGIFKSDDMQGIKRYEGVTSELHAKHLSIEESAYLWYTTEDLDDLFGGAMDSILLKRLSGCTGIVCYNDQIAASFIKLLHRNGLQVPDDFSIVSFDNSPISRQVACDLTSIVYPATEIGMQAANLLLKQIALPGYSRQIILAPELIERSSIQNRL